MRKKTAIALGCAAMLLGLGGLLFIGPHTQAQTTTDQTEKTTKKKKKKSAKSTEAPSATVTPAPAPTPAPTPAEAAAGKKKATAETAEAEKTTKKRKSKKATEVPSQSFVPPGITPKTEESAPPVKNATKGQVRSAQASGMVWVNTDSGIYHKGGRWYGNTKQGKFMTEDEAVKAGYRAAQNEK